MTAVAERNNAQLQLHVSGMADNLQKAASSDTAYLQLCAVACSFYTLPPVASTPYHQYCRALLQHVHCALVLVAGCDNFAAVDGADV